MSKVPNQQPRWVDIFWNSKDSAPNPKRLNRRLSLAFYCFLVAAFTGVAGHFYWGVMSNDAGNFTRGGAFLIGVSILAFGYKKRLFDHERWRYLHKMEREGGADESFLSREFLESSARFFDVANIATAVLGTIISGYGDLWFAAAFLDG